MYDSDGKQDFRELLLALARQDGSHKIGTFWGYGTDTRMFSSAGFDVVAAEVIRARQADLLAHVAEYGYRAHLGRAGKLRERFDMFHADFDGGPSPTNFREVGRIAAITDRWLAVTLSLDHLRDESMQGEAATYTVPAWLTGASGFTLEYLGRYRRNRFGQTMWVAILQRREGKGNSHRVQPVQIARDLRIRSYWASAAMYATGLMPHVQSAPSDRTRERQLAYYYEHRDSYQAIAKANGRRRRSDPDKYAADLAKSAEWRRSERGREWGREYRRKRMKDPSYAEAKRAYHREWYLKKKAAVSGTAAEAVSFEEAA